MSRKILVKKLFMYRLDEQIVRWIENWLNGWAQGVIDGSESSWTPVTNGIHQVSMLRPVLFNVFINDLDDEAECTFRNIAGNTKLGEVADMPESCAASKRDLDRLKKWARRNFIKFNKENCKVLHLGMTRPKHWHRLVATQLESSLAEKDVGILVGHQAEHEPVVCPCCKAG